MTAITNIFKYIFGAFAVLVGFGVTAEIMASTWEAERPVMEASAIYGDMDAQTWTTYPQDVPLVALAKYAHDQVEKRMDAAKSGDAQRKTAAAIFMGYYLKNGRARAEVCDRYDVDISAFVRAFEERHADLHDLSLIHISEPT